MIDYRKIAEGLGIEEAALRAVVDVESNGSGFLSDGRPKILFEAHIFYRELNKIGLNPEKVSRQMPSICSKKWNRALYLGGAREYDRLKKALQVNETAALKSASWGMFQVMGFNYEICGFDSVQKYVEAMQTFEGQIQSFIGFCKTNNLIQHLYNKDWAKFARGYNGPSYAVNKYDKKLEDAYFKYKV